MRRALAALLLCCGALPAVAQEAPDATVAWIKERAVPIKTPEAGNGFEDLQPLKKIIGDARIVSLGESTHGSREIFQMKHRLVEFLASEMNFTIFSIEANMPESYRVNDYVLGGEGDPDKLIAGMYFWTWNTREVKDMVAWMRRFNAGKKGRIEFTGFDMQFPDVAMAEVLKFLKDGDEEQRASAEKAFDRAAQAKEGRSGFGVATGSFPVEAARGKKLVFRGWIKTDGVRGYAGLWWRCDGPEQAVLAFDNMQSREIKGTSDWKQYSLELDVPAGTTNINFGVLMPGSGTAWFDGLEVILDGKRFEKADLFDFDFESESLQGFFSGRGNSHRTDLDSSVAKSGKQSLRLRSVDGPAGTTPAEFKEIVAACKEVHRRLADARDDLVKKRPAKEVDWAIVNANLVVSAIRQRAGDMTIRDAEMAANVEWILRQNPDAKIVLWAHNGHVAKQAFWMGRYLDKKFEKKHLAVAFATAKGEYQAIGKKGLANHKLEAPPPDSYEAAFQRTGSPRFILDLRQVSDGVEAAGWLANPRPFRMIGAMAMDRQFSNVELPKLFDAVIYLEETTAAVPIRR